MEVPPTLFLSLSSPCTMSGVPVPGPLPPQRARQQGLGRAWGGPMARQPEQTVTLGEVRGAAQEVPSRRSGTKTRYVA